MSRLRLPAALALCLFIIPVAADAQEILWDSTGVAVCTADGWQRSPRMVTDGSRGAIIAWEDIRVGSNPAIYAARISADGALPWQSDGVEISTHQSGQRLAGIATDDAGGAYIAYWHRGGGDSDLYMQRISGDGTPRWQQGGVAVCDAGGRQEWAELIPDGAGGVIITWHDGRGDDNDIYAQRLTPEGTALWDADGAPVSRADGDQNYPQLASDRNGGAYIVWMDRRSEDDIYAQHIRADGSLAWQEDFPLCVEPNRQVAPKVISYKENSVAFFWQDYRYGPTTASLYLQVIDENGDRLYAEDYEVSQSENAQTGMFLTDDGEQGALAVWTDFRAGAGEGDVYMRRILADGTIIGDFGNALCDAGDTQERATMISDRNGGGLAIWQDRRNGFDYDIYMNRISAQGQTTYPDWNGHTGVLLHKHDNNQLGPQVIESGLGYAIVCWYDGRTLDGQADIYAQRIAWMPSLAFPDSIDFGIRKVGQTAHDTVTVRNEGAVPLIITNIRRASDPGNTHPRDFTLYPTFTLPDTLMPEEALDIALSFTPEGTGDRISELRISSDAPQDPVIIPLHGLGTNPRLRTKNVHQFNVTKVGAVNEETVEDMLRNTGSGLLLITDINISGRDSANFSLGDNGVFPLRIDEDAYFPLKVRFAPDRTGPFEASMIVASNDGREPESVRLSGFGAMPSLITIPVGLHFDTTMTTRTAEAEVRIRNTSGVQLVVTGIALAGTDADQFTLDAALPMQIPGEGRAPFTVRFTPTGIGFKRAEIVLTSDAPTSPDTMVVDGAAILLDTDSPPAAADFSVDALYPQPLRTGQPLHLRLGLPATGRSIRVRIFDMLGRLRGTLFDDRLSAGYHALRLPAQRLGLTPGMYTLQVHDGMRSAARALIVMD